MTMTTLEARVMEFLLGGADPVLQVLRQQLDASRILKRELTGSGFFTTFEIPEHAKHVEGDPSFEFGDVSATIAGLKNGAGFLLYVRKGLLHMLEGYSYEEDWPEEVRDFNVFYDSGPTRDLVSVRKKWTS